MIAHATAPSAAAHAVLLSSHRPFAAQAEVGQLGAIADDLALMTTVGTLEQSLLIQLQQRREGLSV